MAPDSMRRETSPIKAARSDATAPGLSSNERVYLRPHFGQLFRRHTALRFGIPAAPVNALDLICQNRIRRCAADENLKWIVLDLRRQRTADYQTRSEEHTSELQSP